MLLRRHRLLHNALLLIYAGVAVLVLSVITIGAAVTGSSGAAGTAALALDLAWTVTLLGGLLLAAIDHDLYGRGRLRSGPRPFTRVLISSLGS